jgi:uncharacterized low-complexity protein
LTGVKVLPGISTHQTRGIVMADKKPLITALSTVAAASFSLSAMAAGQQPVDLFEAEELPSGFMVASAGFGEGSCGEGACGEGACGEGACGEDDEKDEDDKDEEGKCGEGKCGEGKCGEGKCGEGQCGEGRCGNA